MNAPNQRHHCAAACAIALLAALLAACGSLLPSAPSVQLYTLTPKSTFDQSIAPVSWQLTIEEPLGAGGLNTMRIAVRPTPTRLEYFAGARWTERAPQMVQTLLVESFENSGKIVAVGRQAVGLRSDYGLQVEMREFQAEYFRSQQTPDVRVRLNAKIVTQPRQEIIASKTFEAAKTAAGSDLPSIVTAFDEALGEVMKDLVEWTLTTAPPVSR